MTYKQPVVINKVDFTDWHLLFSLLFVVYVTPAATFLNYSESQLAAQLQIEVNVIGRRDRGNASMQRKFLMLRLED